jgi:AraC family transcriptional regulator, regulatory protein of adaptative response / methylated-DNA-[protein]-cysteine methyltransferase
VIDTQLNADYKSGSDISDALFKDTAPTMGGHHLNSLKASLLDTPLGPMIAIADESVLYLLEFANRRGLEREVERLRARMNAAITLGITPPIQSIKNELTLYFEGRLQKFTTPLFFLGSDFQKQVWEALCLIPFGETRSYAALASSIGRPKAYRAAANANGANQIALVVPCHRVITSTGDIGGYAGGVARKRWLLHHEQKNYETDLSAIR